MSQNPFHATGPWPAEYALVERLRALGFREQQIQNMAYRQKYAICKDYAEREERRSQATVMQLALDL